MFTQVEAVQRRPAHYNVFDYESFHAIHGIPPPMKPPGWDELQIRPLSNTPMPSSARPGVQTAGSKIVALIALSFLIVEGRDACARNTPSGGT
jgi:hypothetical protein